MITNNSPNWIRAMREVEEDDPLRVSLMQTFWQKVQKSDGCWLWTGASLPPMGHGTIRRGKKNYTVHRLSWEIHRGHIPDGLQVCHHCDVPKCVNPDHLFLGTQADNNRDRHMKGRTVMPNLKGQDHPSAKLTDDDVRAIRAAHHKIPAPKLAKQFGVSLQNIYQIQWRIRWGHI